MKDEDVHRLQNLREEYSKLYSIFEKHWLMPYQIIPIVVTIGGALSIYCKERPIIWGLGISYGFVLLLAWQAFNHVFINETGLKLVELECKINTMTSATLNNCISWQSEMIAKGMEKINGLFTVTVLLGFLIVPIYGGAVFFVWSGLRNIYPNHSEACYAVVLFPTVLIVALIWSMFRTEFQTRRIRKAILEKHSVFD